MGFMMWSRALAVGGCVFDGIMQADIKHILINAAIALQLA
jgi:hypothetical protein